MATSHTTPTEHGRPKRDPETLTGTATTDSALTPINTHDSTTCHPDARGTPPEAPPPAPDPTPPRPPRRRRVTGDRRTTIDAKTDAAIRAAAAKLAEAAPPLDEETRARLALLLSTSSYQPPRARRPAA